MKRFLTLLVAGVMAASLAVPAFSQGAGQKGKGKTGAIQKGQQGRLGKLRQMQQKMFEELNLTDEQKKKIEGINMKFVKELRALRDAPGERAQKAPKMRELLQKRNKGIGDLLTPEQKKKFEELMKKAPGRFGKGVKGGGGGVPPLP